MVSMNFIGSIARGYLILGSLEAEIPPQVDLGFYNSGQQ